MASIYINFSVFLSQKLRTNIIPLKSNIINYIGYMHSEIERFSTERRKTKIKPITCQLDYSANLKP